MSFQRSEDLLQSKASL